MYIVNPYAHDHYNTINDLLSHNSDFNFIILTQKIYNKYINQKYKLNDIHKYNIKTKLGLFINCFNFDGRLIDVYINEMYHKLTQEKEKLITDFIIVGKDLNQENLENINENNLILSFHEYY